MVGPGVLNLSHEVESAISAAKPVVALESTVIAHGLPRPENFDIAQHIIQTVRDAGAVPAQTAILDGKLQIGLSNSQLKFIAENEQIKKISIRDLTIAVAAGWNGATTVASTIWLAYRAGIKVVATGGIGGVHRGALPDVSADLPELSRTPVVVVCSGAKIVLDLPATREWLETNGVAIAGYQTSEMPAFYSRRSGLPVDVRIETPDQIAELVKARSFLGLQMALLVTVPVPRAAEVSSALLERLLNDAIKAAEKNRVGGRELTPFLLSQMTQRSDGATLRANVALLENNARIAAEIAKALGS
ncbi:MAG TPA: pseudouridine-5'-phosphate glycosidase [Pyrinomonadaceae bacterium]|nr:pseudouridine-5'-phosphate glycosidase [Pyrinomonadaceae bacterium]